MNAPAAFIHSVSQSMNPDELFRNVPANVHELRLAIAGLPKDMKVIAHSGTDISEKTVDELRERTTWPAGLVVTTPRELHPKSIVKINKSSLENLKFTEQGDVSSDL
jgi:hypothetical protein